WLDSTDPELTDWYVQAADETSIATAEDIRRTLTPGAIQPKGPERPDLTASGDEATTSRVRVERLEAPPIRRRVPAEESEGDGQARPGPGPGPRARARTGRSQRPRRGRARHLLDAAPAFVFSLCAGADRVRCRPCVRTSRAPRSVLLRCAPARRRASP